MLQVAARAVVTLLSTIAFGVLAQAPGLGSDSIGLGRGAVLPFLKWREVERDRATDDLRGSRFVLVVGDEVCRGCAEELNRLGSFGDAPVFTALIDRNGALFDFRQAFSLEFPMRQLSKGIGLLLPRSAEELSRGGELCVPPLPYVAVVNQFGRIEYANLEE